MSDKLKDFVDFHRSDFDLFEPGEHVWTGISTGLAAPAGWLGSKLVKGFLKFGFGASALVTGTLGTYYLLKSPAPSNMDMAVKTKVEVVHKKPVALDSRIATNNNAETALLKSDLKENPLFKHTEEKSNYANVPDSLKSTQNEIEESNNENASETDENHVNEKNFSGLVINHSVQVPIVQNNITYYGLSEDENSRESRSNLSQQGDSLVIDTLFEGIKKLIILSEYCEVSIRGAKSDKVKIHGVLGLSVTQKGRRNKKTVEKKFMGINFEKNGNVLTAKISLPGGGNNFMFGGSCSTTMESSKLFFDVPETIDLSVSNNDGNVKAFALSGTEFAINTGYGSISCENISTNVKLRSSSGNIKLYNISGDVDANSSYGNIKLAKIKGAVKLRASSGNIKVNDLKGNGILNSSYGSIKLDSVAGNLDVRASSGNVSIDKLSGNISINCTYGTSRLNNVSGDIGVQCSSGSVLLNNTTGKLLINAGYGNVKGESVRLTQNSDFKISSGKLHLNLLNKLDELSFDLQSASGNITVEKENFKSRSSDKLSFGQGAIKITATSSYGNQFFN